MRFVSLALLVSPAMGAILQRRQVNPSDIPAQCQDTCAPALALQSSCALPSCLCTSSSEDAIQTCANCAIPLNPSLETTLQPYLQDFGLLCPGLPPLTFPPIPQSTSTDSSSPAPADTDTNTDTGTAVAGTNTSDTSAPSPSDTGNTATPTNGNTTPTATGATPAATYSAPGVTTVHTSSSTSTSRVSSGTAGATPTTTQTSAGLLTAEFSTLPIGLVALIAAYTLA